MRLEVVEHQTLCEVERIGDPRSVDQPVRVRHGDLATFDRPGGADHDAARPHVEMRKGIGERGFQARMVVGAAILCGGWRLPRLLDKGETCVGATDVADEDGKWEFQGADLSCGDARSPLY